MAMAAGHHAAQVLHRAVVLAKRAGLPLLCISLSRSQCASTSKSCEGVRFESKSINAAHAHLLMVMQALHVILSRELALRRLLGALVLHALGEILANGG